VGWPIWLADSPRFSLGAKLQLPTTKRLKKPQFEVRGSKNDAEITNIILKINDLRDVCFRRQTDSPFPPFPFAKHQRTGA
jgi:hypothetical protein